jgi:prepilin-type N-terminal cleavage/methylation domain-containing protein
MTARREAGFTLVEAMVAVVVLAVGVLGLAGSAAVMTRQMSSGRRMAGAAALASARFEQLVAQDCTKLANGTASLQGFTEQWTVTAVPRAVRVTEKVSFAGERWQRTQTYTTILSCPANP